MDEINEWIEALNDSGYAIIVEGIKDEKALTCIGIKNRLFRLSREPLFAVAEKVAGSAKKVVILTDFDKKGKELYGKLYKDLQKLGVKIDKRFREWLQKNTKLSHIEGLDTYYRNCND